ncbi:MAG: multiple sugar transport system permease [Beijerinckiaceae bacterium]|nr:MAG: multiple sugar transport system permease [Beijerinckiaceae bacterium]
MNRLLPPSHRLPGFILAHAALLAGACFMLLPFVWMLLTAIRAPDEILTGGLNPIPRSFHAVENFSGALAQAPLLNFMLNGAIVCAGILVVQLIVAIPAAYALAKLRFRARGLLFALVIAGLCVPIQVPALPLYLALAEFNLLDSYFAMMLPFFLSVFAIFLFRQTFKTFPDEIIHAARVDGVGEFEILWRIVVPSAFPAIAAFSIFSIVAHWNDLYWPMIVIQRLEYAPPPLGMLFFTSSESGASYGVLMAGATIITAPLVIVFLIARRRFVQGITMTGIK